jgi:hypothetical protein
MVILLSRPDPALATFSPIVPPNCSTGQWTNVPYRFRVGGVNVFEADVAENFYQGGTYLPNIILTRYLYANSWVRWFDFNVPNFDTEAGYDYVAYGRVYHPTPIYALSGSNIAGSYYMVRFGDESLQTAPAYFKFSSDSTIQGLGLDIDGIRVCSRDTKDNPYNAPFVHSGQRFTGVLLGTNDVVYFPVSVTSAVHTTFALWGDYPNDVGDFDLYVRCGLLPTETAWDYRGFSADASEFIHTSDLSYCQGIWWVAVHAYDGGGMFNFMTNEHLIGEHFSNATANLSSYNDQTQLSSWAQGYRDGFKELFGATEGSFYVETLDLWNSNGNPNAAMQFSNTCGVSDSPIGCKVFTSAGPVGIFGQNAKNSCAPTVKDRTIAHELSHLWSGLDDEYNSQGGNCGHTIMDTGYIGSTFNYCRAADHDTAHISGGGHAPGGPGWSNSCLLNKTTFRPLETPDNYSFRAFDFNGLFGTVVIH